jgi:VCBS repeat-containing protein
MKRLFGLLNLLLCLELIIGTHFPGARIFTIDVAKAQTCPSGLVFDSTLNRCITSDQNAALINATASCNGDKECYKRLAEEELKKGEEERKIEEAVKNKSGLFNTGLKVAAIAAPLTIGLMSLGRTRSKCASISMISMVAGGLAFVVGDVMANKKHKSCLKKIREDWEKNKEATTEKTSTGATKVSLSQDQSEAFEQLAKSEECMKSSAKMKAGFYMASMVAFGVSAATATLEALASKANHVEFARNICPVASVDQPKDSQELVQEFLYANYLDQAQDVSSYLVMKESIKSEQLSCASVDRYREVSGLFEKPVNKNEEILVTLKSTSRMIVNTIIPEAQATPLAMSAGEGVGAFLTKPETRAVLSGIFTAWSMMMMSHANKQAKVAGNRADFLRKLKQDFNDASGAISCTSEERNMSANANCYCYTENGQRNQARGSSQICQQLWTGQTVANAGIFNSTDFSTQRVCISSTGQADEACACRQTRSCLSAIPGTNTSLGLGSISAATNGLTPLNDLAGGNISAAQLNGSASLNTAARLLDQKKELEKKLNDKNLARKQSNLAKEIEGSLIAGAAGQPSPLALDSNLPLNMSASQAAQALERELGAERSFERVSGSPAIGQPGNSNPGAEAGFSLGVEEPTAISQETQLAEVMKQDLNYNQADITKSDSNIFQILTNRYQRSGMKRLFDESEKTSPEPANKNDISQ